MWMDWQQKQVNVMVATIVRLLQQCLIQQMGSLVISVPSAITARMQLPHPSSVQLAHITTELGKQTCQTVNLAHQVW